MVASLLLLFKFGSDIVKRLIHDAHFRALGIALLIVLLAGTLFFWLVEGRQFLHALAYSVGTMAMNPPYGFSWGPATTGGVIFNLLYVFFSVGVFLLFVLEAGKTMVRSCEEHVGKKAERKASKHAKVQDATEESRGDAPSPVGPAVRAKPGEVNREGHLLRT